MKGYFGQSTAYRMLRVLAICELVERQIAYADFAVDPDMRSLLRFKRFALMALSSSRVSLGHPMEDWNEQSQHVFYDVLGIIASSMIAPETPGVPSRVIRFDEFAEMLGDKTWAQRIAPIPHLLSGLTAKSKPILWLRLLALAQLCIGLQRRHGGEIGLETDDVNVDWLLLQTNDSHISKNGDMYRTMLRKFGEVLSVEV